MNITKNLERWTKDEEQFIIENYLNMSNEQIGEELGRTPGAISHRMKILNLKRMNSSKKSEKAEKLTYDKLKDKFTKRNYTLLTSEDDYNSGNNQLSYICQKHKDSGVLSISYYHFCQGQGCLLCGRERTGLAHTKDLSEKDKELCESLGLTYIRTIKKDEKPAIEFICKSHVIFGTQIMMRSNMKRKTTKGCKYCLGKGLPHWYVKNQIEEKYPKFIVTSNYLGMNKPLTCYCKDHDKSFTHDAKYIYYKGYGCADCYTEKRFNSQRLQDDEILSRVADVSPDIEIVDLTEYKGYEEPLLVRCKKCGYEWYTTLASILANHIVCPNCSSFISKGENRIKKYLLSIGSNFQTQYMFPDCKDKRLLKFDFCIFDNVNNILGLIEYQGEQHYKPIEYFGGEEKYQQYQKRDKIKRNYCQEHLFELLEIPYWEYDNIETIVDDYIKRISK